jgi:hypothetical protein
MPRSHFAFLNVALLSSALLVLSNVALAQDPPAPQPLTPSAPSTEPAVPTAAALDGEAPAPPACYPPCREGFLCNAGACISACNPPCPAGQQCNGEAQCVADAPVLAPSYPPPSYPSPSYPEPSADEPPPPDPTRYRHDGFLLRATIGLGFAAMHESGGASYGAVDYTGAGLMLSLDVGAAVSDDFSVFGRLSLLSIGSPAFETERGPQGPSEGTLDEQGIGAVLLGAGASYQLMPLNMYFALAAGLNVISISEAEDGEPEGDTAGSPQPGIGVNVDVGKEWWVAPQVGLGIALRFWGGTGGFESDSGGTELDRTLLGGALLFSFTFQ